MSSDLCSQPAGAFLSGKSWGCCSVPRHDTQMTKQMPQTTSLLELAGVWGGWNIAGFGSVEGGGTVIMECFKAKTGKSKRVLSVHYVVPGRLTHFHSLFQKMCAILTQMSRICLIPARVCSVCAGDAAILRLPGVRGGLHLGIHLPLPRPPRNQK